MTTATAAARAGSINMEDLTPERAKSYLDDRNADACRPFSRDRLASFLKDIRNGNWDMSNPPVLRFDENGRMFDGQHVCAAVHASGVTIKVIRFDSSDTSMSRISANSAYREPAQSRIRNTVKYAPLVASLARIAFAAERMGLPIRDSIRAKRHVVTDADVIAITGDAAEEFELACEAARRIARSLTRGSNRGACYLTLPCYLALTYGDASSFACFEMELTNKDTKNPVMKALRKKLTYQINDYLDRRSPAAPEKKLRIAGLFLLGFEAYRSKAKTTSFDDQSKWLTALTPYDTPLSARYKANVSAGKASK